MKPISYISWIVLTMSLVAWAGIIYTGMWLKEAAAEQGRRSISAEAQATNAAYLSRLQSLASDTRADRERLETLARSDIVNLASAIEASGREVGAQVKVNSALPVGSKEIPGGDSLRSVSFMIQAEGAFPSLVRLVKILEQFPAFSSIEQLELQRSGEPGSATAWRASIRMLIKTTSDISS